ncbi:hypothetical protein KC332_g5240 [Hortaea werneckii]|nr:hypothetical protein KC358_g10780 [Hortaea werneckii]OTA32836.1 hypothetical protein BTJ68_06846 [Hortaea werneckii EXF-2000]KAI6819450.1 hypothetical protein KC350_g10066 [Hortaea werneckii]KAI6918119.1 hypothetical protein KC348_g11027 [Hortaea werneckii]KAI6937101.1 hypothetical protein KC341_g5776 [Hortaea werneckii]
MNNNGRTGHDRTQSPAPPIGQLVGTILRRKLGEEGDQAKGEAKIADQQFVASFNWLETKMPAIAVPGAPPRYDAPKIPRQLQKDSGEFFRDKNAARFPNHPLEPTVRAIFLQNSLFDPAEIDIFACGSTFGNLLRFVRQEDKTFRFVVEKVGRTFFFPRCENTPHEMIPDVRGYGHSFPKAYNSWHEEWKGSSSAQRMVAYTFCGRRYIIRSESDGYLPEKLGGDGPTNVSVDLTSPIVSAADGLSIRNAGTIIPQSAIFDLKTRSLKRRNEDHVEEQLGRLWANRTPNFVVAFHDRGLFSDIRKLDVQAKVDQWESKHTTELRMLGRVVEQIIKCCAASSNGRCEVVSGEIGELQLREVGGRFPRGLPQDLKSLWTQGDSPISSSLHVADAEADAQEGVEAQDDEDSDEERVGEEDSGKGAEKDGWSSDEELDYTACSAEDCGYCGHCRY